MSSPRRWSPAGSGFADPIFSQPLLGPFVTPCSGLPAPVDREIVIHRDAPPVPIKDADVSHGGSVSFSGSLAIPGHRLLIANGPTMARPVDEAKGQARVGV